MQRRAAMSGWGWRDKEGTTDQALRVFTELEIATGHPVAYCTPRGLLFGIVFCNNSEMDGWSCFCPAGDLPPQLLHDFRGSFLPS
ncbi:hypothetical protein NDU88_007230 [Pleurodeles waltl]|uniref:Uncharacterized protein n=1 Tax=Pleurodeles waltl TaxID=8319 RepID=A0AAV7MFV5_PLEWA|nr:hypothetical protein NDU88_007230 [Pleurodeles waltl]